MSDRKNDRRPEGLPPTSRSLPIALIRAREAVMAPIREMLSETGLTEQQWRVLRVLNETGPQDATSLAERTSLLMPSLTRIVQSMSERKLVRQDRDTTDRRRQVIAITEEGEALLLRNMPQAAKIAENLQDRLGRKKLDQLLDLLDEVSSPRRNNLRKAEPRLDRNADETLGSSQK